MHISSVTSAVCCEEVTSQAGLTILYGLTAGSMSKYPQHWLDIAGMKKGHGKRGITFEAVPVVDLIDTREIIQSLDSDPELVRVHGSSDGEFRSTSQIRG